MDMQKIPGESELPGKRKIAAGKKIKIMILAWICWKLWSIPWRKVRRRN